MTDEIQGLLSSRNDEHSNQSLEKNEYGAVPRDTSMDEKNAEPRFFSNSENKVRGQGHNRAVTIGTVRNKEAASLDINPRSRVKAYSVAGDGRSYISAAEFGRRELYIQIPFTSVFGLQAKERDFELAYARFVATMNVKEHPEWSENKRRTQSTETEKTIINHLDDKESAITLPFALAVLVAATSQFSVGYNTGVMNAPEKVIFPGHSQEIWSLAVAAFAVGGPFGAFLGGRLADLKGRRGALMINIWMFLFGGALQTMSTSMQIIVLARFIIGFASGFSSVLVPIYLGELAPPRLRGALGTLTQFAMVIGILVADLFAFPFATSDKWRYLFAVTPICAMAQILASPLLLESPRWLISQNPKSEIALSIIGTLRGLDDSQAINDEVANYIVGEAAQRSDLLKSQFEIACEMLRHKQIRTLLLSTFVLQMSQQLGGINAVFYYSTSFFEGVIDNPLVGTTLVGIVNVLATYAALLLMDSCGRRTLILWSTGGMFFSCVVIILSLLGFLSNVMALLAVMAYVAFFEIGLGPIPWLIVAEMFDGNYIATAMSLCSQLNWFCNFIIGLAFPWLNSQLGSYTFAPFAVVLAFCFFFALLVLPETQGTTPEKLISEIVQTRSMHVIFDPNLDSTQLKAQNEWAETLLQIKEESLQMMKQNV